MPYLDTSMLGSYYCPETLSDVVNAAMSSIDDAVISPIVELELCSLVALKVRTRELGRNAGHNALSKFRLHLSEGLYGITDIGPREYDLARDWLSAFSTSLRTLDALHLACAFCNHTPVWTTDKPMAQAAETLGIECRLFSLRRAR